MKKTGIIRKSSEGITAPQGFKAAGTSCGIKKSGGKDLALIYSEVPSKSVALFTANKMKAAPLVVSKKNSARGAIQAIVVNSGNANSCTGKQGLEDALKTTELVATNLGLASEKVLVASTGLIGVSLPIDKVEEGIEKGVRSLSVEGGLKTAQAIMTTDTFPKEIAVEFKINQTKVTIGGIAKGAGMIAPNLATMLAFFTSDAVISEAFLKECFKKAIDNSFNMITVDGTMSTNDMVVILANGLAQNEEIKTGTDEALVFQEALNYACQELAKMIVRDGEGATKFIEVQVRGSRNFLDAKKAGMAIANSPLVKTAFFGEDANWGRIIAALGEADVEMSPSQIELYFDSVLVVKDGTPLKYDREKVDEILKSKEISIAVDLGSGKEEATIWTCDLSYEYVRLNAEYQT